MEPLYVDWATFKVFIQERNLSIQWIIVSSNTYRLRALDGSFSMDCSIPMDGGSDQSDFETNFKDAGNKTPKSEVVTQYEKSDKTLKIVHGEAEVGQDGLAIILIKVPGTPGSGDGRLIASGIAFFSEHHSGDKAMVIHFVDHDNLLGYGADFVVGSYTDDEADVANQGWAIPPSGWIKAEAIGGYGRAPAGFYIRIVGKKAPGHETGTFYVNIEWGKLDTSGQ